MVKPCREIPRQRARSPATAAWKAVGLAAAATMFLLAAAAQAQTVLSPDQALQMSRDGRVTLVDVRGPDEWETTGLPAGAKRATIRSDNSAAFLRRMAQITQGDKDRPIALICAAGMRSKYASRLLRQQGYSRVHDISEGMLGNRRGPGWLGRNLPVSPCNDC